MQGGSTSPSVSQEPALIVHVPEGQVLPDGAHLAQGLWQMPLCIASALLTQGKAHLVEAYEEPEGGPTTPYWQLLDQAALVSWMQSQGLTLASLARASAVSRAMLTYVSRGERRLTSGPLEGLLRGYGQYVLRKGCSAR
ncbi:MAG: hypothetical protein ACE5JU_24440 [Candidatus Binatia bacterium]